MTESLARLHRPKADTIEISDLLVEARAGKYELPNFQRDLEWKKEDRIKLFDSIYRGFPIGDILFWEPEEPQPGVVRFGPFSPAKHQANPWLIVDGQQRLATLFGCLLLPERQTEEEEDDNDDWRFAFHVDQGRIVELPLGAAPEFLPLPIAIDTSRYLRWTRSLPEERWDERMQAGDDFSKALRTYRIPFYVVRTRDHGLLREVFERVNNTGKALSMEAVFSALFPGAQEEQGRLDEIARELEVLGFGRLQPDWLLQAVKAMVGMDPVSQFSAELRRMDEQDEALKTPGRTREELGKIHPRLKRAATAAIEVLQSAGIRRVEALPYALVLPPLMHFFDRFPPPCSESITKMLHRLIWLVAASGAGQQHRSTYQRAAARLIRGKQNQEVVANNLVAHSEDVLDRVQANHLVEQHDWRSGATRLVELALFELEPRELETGAVIPVWDVLPDKGHKLFQRIWTHGIDGFAASSANRLISMTVGRSGKNSMLEKFAASPLFPVSREILASQAITQEAWGALQNGEQLQFLRLRATRIAEVVDSFLHRHLSEG